MATPIIQTSGSTSGAGTAGVSRTDGVLGETITFSNTEGTHTGQPHVWTIRDQPVGAAAVLVGPTTATPTLVLDGALAGSYFVRCTVNGVDISSILVVVTTVSFGLVKPAWGEQLQMNEGGNARGWMLALNDVIDVVDTLSGAAGNTLTGAYNQGGAGAGRTVIASAGALAVSLTSATVTHEAFTITESAVARTGVMMSLTRDAAVVDAGAHALSIANAGGGFGLNVVQTGANVAARFDRPGGATTWPYRAAVRIQNSTVSTAIQEQYPPTLEFTANAWNVTTVAAEERTFSISGYAWPNTTAGSPGGLAQLGFYNSTWGNYQGLFIYESGALNIEGGDYDADTGSKYVGPYLSLGSGNTTNLPASTEKMMFRSWGTGSTHTWKTGALTNQRWNQFLAPTVAFVGASTITNAANLYVDKPSVIDALATVTNNYNAWFDEGIVAIDDQIEMVERADHVRVATAGRGAVWLRSDTPNVLVFTDDAGTDWDLNTVGGGGGSLDASYTIGQTIDADLGPVAISSANADNNHLLTLVKNPAGAQSGNAINVTIGASASGYGLYIANAGTGIGARVINSNASGTSALLVSNASASAALLVSVNTSDGSAIDVTEDSIARTDALVRVVRGSTSTNSGAYGIEVLNAALGNNAALKVTQSGDGDAFRAFLQTSTACEGIVITEDAVARTAPMVRFVRDAAVLSTAAHVISVINAGAAAGVNIASSGTGPAINVTAGQVLTIAGSASAPSLSTIADVNTGTYYPSADQFGITTGGTLATFWNASQQQLAVDGTASAPTYSYASDTNTGWYSRTSDHLYASLGGFEAIVFGESGHTMTTVVNTGGTPEILTLIGAAHTSLVNAEQTDFYVNSARTVDFDGGGGAIANQRTNRFTAPTFTAAAAQTITTAATMALSGPPVASTNITIGTAYTLDIESGDLHIGGDTIGDGQFLAATSSAAAPGYSISGDPNTGIYDVAADSLGVSTGGVQAVRWDSSQNQYTANQILTPDGTSSNCAYAFAGGLNYGFRKAGSVVIATANTSTSAHFAPNQLRVVAGSIGTPGLSTTSDTNTGVYFPSADNLAISTGGTQAVYWDASQKLWQKGDVDVAGQIKVNHTAGSLAGVIVEVSSSDTASTGISVIDQVSVARTGALIQLVRGGLATGAALRISGSTSGVNNGIYIDHKTSAIAIEILNSSTNTSSRMLKYNEQGVSTAFVNSALAMDGNAQRISNVAEITNRSTTSTTSGLLLTNLGAGYGLTITMNSSLVNSAIRIIETNAVRTTPMMSITRGSSATGAALWWTGAVGQNGINVLTDAATIATNCAHGNVHQVTLTATGHAIGAPTNAKSGFFYTWRVVSGASYTLTWNAVFNWPGGTAPTVTDTAGAVDYFSGFYNGTNFEMFAAIQDVK